MNRTGAILGLVVAVVAASSMRNWLIDTMLYHPTPGIDIRPAQVGLEGEEVFLEAEDGVRIHAFWLPAEGATRALLFLHGNAGNASHRLPNAALLQRLGLHVLLLDYRGYGKSDGHPHEAGLYADARAGLDHIVVERGVPLERIVVFGRSLGGAVAVDVAQDRDLAGLILESTFSSLADAAASVFTSMVSPLVRGRFDSAEKIGRVRVPLLFFHGDRDEIVPYALGRRLFEAAKPPKAFESLPGAGHNDTVQVGGPAYIARIREFVDRVAP